MTKYYLLLLLGLVIMQACTNTSGPSWPAVSAPVAKVEPKVLEEHGNKRTDNYFWLRDDGVRQKNVRKDIIDYLNAENAYTDTMMAGAKGLQDKLYNEIIARIKQDDNSVPYKDGDYYYYTRFEKGKSYPIYCRKKGNLEAAEEILLDGNKEAEGKKFYRGSIDVSENGMIMAIFENTTGDDVYTTRFKDLSNGKAIGVVLQNTSGGTWALDNKTYFYNVLDNTQRSYKVMRHTVGTQQSADATVYHEKDETYRCFVGLSKSKKYLMVGSYSTLSSEYSILEADKPTGQFRVFAPRKADFLYDVDHQNDRFIIRTNWDAQNFRLMETAQNATDSKNWKEIIAHRAAVLLENVEVFANHMVLTERDKGLVKLRVMNLKDKTEHYIDFQDPAYLVYSSTNVEYNTNMLRFGYTSLTTPNSTYDYDMDKKERKLMKQEEVVGGTFKPEDYESKRIWAKAQDGTEVPISLVYRKDKKKDKNPLWLYAYGSYGASMDPTFSSTRLSLLDRGFIFAIAHVRGGEDMGRQWYLDGKLMKKKNTFTDFNDCAEHLIKEGYTSKELLFANGGSAGGLLMGAIVNMRPDLYKGVVAQVPFVDVISTMMDASIPLTTGEWDEWGNPIKDKAAYDYMLSYSPYDQVKAQSYPNLLVTTGLYDSRVAYWEPAKWVAKLRATKTDKNVLLFKTNMSAGHGGASGRYERYKEISLNYAFALHLLGVKE